MSNVGSAVPTTPMSSNIDKVTRIQSLPRTSLQRQHQLHPQQHQQNYLIQSPSSILQNNQTNSNSIIVSSSGGVRTQGVVLSTASGNISLSNNVYVSSPLTDSQTSSLPSNAKKRLKLNEDCKSEPNDISALKKRILEHKYSRLKNVKDK